MKGVQLCFLQDDTNEAYDAFVDKFMRKKTTDDCYTPEGVYNAVAAYVRDHYKLGNCRFVRPFWPDTDYEEFAYQPGDVVVDNPPFSIINKIVRYYQEKGISFFLFAPGLVINLTRCDGITYIATATTITYENGAKVNTNFVTNLEPGCMARSCPELRNKIIPEAKKYEKTLTKNVAKYRYPDNIVTAAILNYLSVYGQEFTVRRGKAKFIPELEEQKRDKKSIFGGALLVTDDLAAEKAAAERAAAERAAAHVWKLSEKERKIIEAMNKAEKG